MLFRSLEVSSGLGSRLGVGVPLYYQEHPVIWKSKVVYFFYFTYIYYVLVYLLTASTNLELRGMRSTVVSALPSELEGRQFPVV